MEELLNAKKQISEGKAPGDEGIMPEIDDIILFANKLLIMGEKRNQLAIFNLKSIPKSRILRDTGNYRGISLTSVVARLNNRMLLNCIRPIIDPCLRYCTIRMAFARVDLPLRRR